jgi:hypothetical protein
MLSASLLLLLLASSQTPMAVPAPPPDLDTTAFAEVVISLNEDPVDGVVLARVDRIYLVLNNSRQPVNEFLEIGCDRSRPGSVFTLQPGDVLPLIYEVQKEPSTGWLFFGGDGGEAQLSIPDNGWAVSCNCKRDPEDETRTSTLHGRILDSDGRLMSSLLLVGDDEPLIPRLLPLWHGDPPVLPWSLTILLSWEPMT